MTVYSAESFYRAKISQSITASEPVPFTVRLSKLPTLTNGLLTISPNTENEEICEYNNPQVWTMTVDIIKRGIKPDSILLTTNGTDYNNVDYYKAHTQNDIIRGDVNHIHINQASSNSTLATNLWVGISKLSVAAVDPWDPIVVWDNDPRLTPSDASTSVKWVTKLSVAPVSAANPIAVGDNDTRLDKKFWSYFWNMTSGASLDATFRNIAAFGSDNDNEVAFSGTLITGLASMTWTITNNSYSSSIVLWNWDRCRISANTWGTNQIRVIWDPDQLKDALTLMGRPETPNERIMRMFETALNNMEPNINCEYIMTIRCSSRSIVPTEQEGKEEELAKPYTNSLTITGSTTFTECIPFIGGSGSCTGPQ